jgi:hypothetical protein
MRKSYSKCRKRSWEVMVMKNMNAEQTLRQVRMTRDADQIMWTEMREAFSSCDWEYDVCRG